MSANSESWGTRVGLILAMAGNAVGLGNFLRFPAQAVQNGGGAFIIPYIVCFLIMGIPLLWIEWAMGRYGGKYNNHSTPFILDSMVKGSWWKYFGVFGIFTNIAVASYYCYIESWTLSYVFHSVFGTFSGMSETEITAFFGEYTNSTTGIPVIAIIAYLVCLFLNTYILSRGLSGGVEKVAKFGMPLLIAFGAILAIRGLTLGTSGAYEGCVDCDSSLALNFLWEPKFDSLTNPRVWLAAAGQIFFTLSVGMGTIQCYAAYLREKDDIALNAMSAGWMNSFVEVVLGASVVVPIAAGYLGLDWVKENVGFSMAFQTMPYLFSKWGEILGALAGLMWFGLLFFAGITSSLAMGTPWMGFMRDEFNWDRNKGAISFGIIVLIFGMPTVLFYDQGIFGEYDDWAGTISLVIFGLAECIIFSWIFGIEKGWEEIKRGADITVPAIYKPIIKWITPTFLLIIFLSALFKPMNNDWGKAFSGDWELDPGSIIGKITNKGIIANHDYFSNVFESEVDGQISKVEMNDQIANIAISNLKTFYKAEDGKVKIYSKDLGEKTTFDSLVTSKVYNLHNVDRILVRSGDPIKVGEKIAEGTFTNKVFYIDLSKWLLASLYIGICFVVYLASVQRSRKALND